MYTKEAAGVESSGMTDAKTSLNRRQILGALAIAAIGTVPAVHRRTERSPVAKYEPIPAGYDRAEWIATGAGHDAFDAHVALTREDHDPGEAAALLRDALAVLEAEFHV